MNGMLAVTTLPIQISDDIKFGTMTAPLYASIIANKFGGKSYLLLNKYSGFKRHEGTQKDMIARLNKYGIATDIIMSDEDLTDQLYSALAFLDKQGLLHEETQSVYCCECGRVNVLAKSIKSYTVGKLYNVIDGRMTCSFCKGLCNETQKKVLIFRSQSDGEILDLPSCVYHNNFKQIHAWFSKDGILVSKEHATGINYKGFNIDVDFFWSLFIGCLSEKNIVIVCSNKHLVKLFTINELAKIFQKNTIFIIHPLITRKPGEHFSESLTRYDNNLSRLFIYYAAKWNTRECYYNTGTIKALAKLRGKGREELWGMVNNPEIITANYLYPRLMHWIEHEISLQKDLQEKIKKPVAIHNI